MKSHLAVASLGLALATGSLAGADGFDGIVRNVERTYDARRTTIPFLGLANMIVKIARPAGTASFRLAIFEDLDIPEAEEGRFIDVVSEGAGKRWQPIIRMRSRHSGETTAIYTRRSGRMMSMLLATYESGEATIIQVKVDRDLFAEWIQDPAVIGDRITDHDEGGGY